MMMSSTRTILTSGCKQLINAPNVGRAFIARRGYHENIVEHYENPRNVGSLDKNDASVGTVRKQIIAEGMFRETIPSDSYSFLYCLALLSTGSCGSSRLWRCNEVANPC
jgi:hypothetical protein